MSFTVYSRILLFEQSTPNFTFTQKGSAVVGLLSRNEWFRQGGKLSQLDAIQQKERWGTFMVFEYPQSFAEDIDQIIKKYVKVVIDKGRKDVSGKPAHPQKQQKQNQSGPSSSPQRKRKRIPIVKPAFSGSQVRK